MVAFWYPKAMPQPGPASQSLLTGGGSPSVSDILKDFFFQDKNGEDNVWEKQKIEVFKVGFKTMLILCKYFIYQFHSLGSAL